MRPLAAALAAVLLLAACATAPPAPPPAELGDRFRLQARVALRGEGPAGPRSGVLLLTWRQQDEAFRVRVADRLGRTLAVVEGDARTVRIDRPGAEPVSGPRGSTLRRFLGAETGFDLPLDVLPWWLRGRPDPGRPSRPGAAPPGATAFEQAGFRVERPGDWPEGPLRVLPLDGVGPSARAVLSAFETCTAEALDAC